MSDRYSVEVSHIGKRYKIGSMPTMYRTFRETLADRLKRFRSPQPGENQAETFWALDDISFKVKEGQALGIIGRNGAGKSTLLKILSRVTDPTVGSAKLHGRLLEPLLSFCTSTPQ